MFDVVFVVDGYPLVSQTFVSRQVQSLVAQGVRVSIVSLSAIDAEQQGLYRAFTPEKLSTSMLKRFFKMKGIAPFLLFLIKAALKGNLSLIKHSLRYVLGVNQLIKADVVVCHFLNNGVYAELMRRHGIMNVCHSFTIAHGYELSTYKMLQRWQPFYRWLFERADSLLPVSQLWQERLAAMGCPPSKLTVQRMGVDCSCEQSVNGIYEAGDVLKIITVGRATEKKGIEYAIRAMCQLDNVEYTIIGGGELESQHRSLINELGLRNKINFLGACSHDVVMQHLNQNHVFLLPSITARDGDMEGVPVVLMEAMAKGLTVVSTYHSGIPELVEHGVTGLLCAERSVEDIQIALNSIQLVKVDIRKMQASAREKVLLKYNSEKLDSDFYSLLKASVSRPS